MKKFYLMVFAAMLAFMSAAAPKQGTDAEIAKETSENELRYVGVFPDNVKTIAFISPASYPGSKAHRRGIVLIEKAGYKVKVMPHAFTKPEKSKQAKAGASRYGSAPLADRLADFYAAWNDPEVDMIICVRGGRGSEELLKNLDWSKLQKRPELYFQGYSDVTLITGALLAKGYGHPVAGPMAGGLSGLRDPFIAEMKAMYHGEAVGPYKLKALVPGDCSGLPLTGHLERLTRLAGADFRPDTKGRIIFIESVRATPELIREQLQTLIDRKFFDGAAGVVLCQFVKCGKAAEVNAVLEEFAPKFGVPVYRGFPFGHSSRCAAIDFSRKVVIKDNQLTFPAVVKEK
ncbi:MAG: LD-carboxypeptidase [Lentisphaeria bacterium]|nr:LD-carboxypeptidase [Lentisphaeria bacterium]